MTRASACCSPERIYMGFPIGTLPQANAAIGLQIGHEHEVRATHVHLIPKAQRKLQPSLSVEGGLVLADEMCGLGHAVRPNYGRAMYPEISNLITQTERDIDLPPEWPQ